MLKILEAKCKECGATMTGRDPEELSERKRRHVNEFHWNFSEQAIEFDLE